MRQSARTRETRDRFGGDPVIAVPVPRPGREDQRSPDGRRHRIDKSGERFIERTRVLAERAVGEAEEVDAGTRRERVDRAHHLAASEGAQIGSRVRHRVRVRRLAVGRDDDGDTTAALVHPPHQPRRPERLVVGMSGDHNELIQVDMQEGRCGDALIGSPDLLRRALVQVAEADHQSPTAAASSRPIRAVSRGP